MAAAALTVLAVPATADAAASACGGGGACGAGSAPPPSTVDSAFPPVADSASGWAVRHTVSNRASSAS
ncbi:hypothetical protein ACFVZX_14770, partial [Streptomyces erythrochromogenes]